jgi:hypothetical protein
MTLRFRFTHVIMNLPVLPLGGRFVRPRPLIPIALVGPSGSKLLDAIADTAADDTVFAEASAAQIGVDLSNAPTGTAIGVGGNPVAVRYAEILLRLTDGQELREWTGWVGFTQAKFRYPMLGFAGCLRFFDTLIRGAAEEVELTVNSLYPGT